MAIDTLDFNGRPNFAVEFGVAMTILIEMAVGTVHATFHVDVHHVHRQPIPLLAIDFLLRRGRDHGGLQLGVGSFADWCTPPIEQLALPIFFVDGPVDPAVPVEVRELRVLQMRVEFTHVGQEFGIPPQPPHRGFIGIATGAGNVLLGGNLGFMRGVHQLAIGFVIPPHVAQI